MTPRYITVDNLGRIYEITHMYDRNAKRTFDPASASSVVIRVGDGSCEADADDVPIYTVH